MHVCACLCGCVPVCVPGRREPELHLAACFHSSPMATAVFPQQAPRTTLSLLIQPRRSSSTTSPRPSLLAGTQQHTQAAPRKAHAQLYTVCRKAFSVQGSTVVERFAGSQPVHMSITCQCMVLKELARSLAGTRVVGPLCVRANFAWTDSLHIGTSLSCTLTKQTSPVHTCCRFQRAVLKKGQLLKRGKAGALFGDRYAVSSHTGPCRPPGGTKGHCPCKRCRAIARERLVDCAICYTLATINICHSVNYTGCTHCSMHCPHCTVLHMCSLQACIPECLKKCSRVAVETGLCSLRGVLMRKLMTTHLYQLGKPFTPLSLSCCRS